jgi:hypothetical protein
MATKRAMINWRARKIAKRGKQSQTPGKAKGDRCMTGKIKKFFFSHPHAFRHPQYQIWHDLAKGYAGASKEKK